jgi:hypothetical protein
MPFLRKAIMLAITSGLAKKAWDSYSRKNPAAAQRVKSDLSDAGRTVRDSISPSASKDKDKDKDRPVS